MNKFAKTIAVTFLAASGLAGCGGGMPARISTFKDCMEKNTKADSSTEPATIGTCAEATHAVHGGIKGTLWGCNDVSDKEASQFFNACTSNKFLTADAAPEISRKITSACGAAVATVYSCD